VTSESILLVGAGGHAKACIDVIEQEGRFSVVGLVGQADEVGSLILGYPVLGTDADLPALLNKSRNALVTIGQVTSPELRRRLFKVLEQMGYNLPTVISPIAFVSPHAKIGVGSIIMHGAIVNAGAVVGRNCILNSKALVEHDAIIGDHCHISTGALINGTAHIGTGTFVGSGSGVRQCLNVGEHSIIGMGQQVIVDCDAETRMPNLKESS
jgi:sugar O-acyltransferase (sialic acid O-acetyltransferase NeuD family)